MLINKVKALFSGTDTNTLHPEDRNLELACAALMFEVARADFAIEAAEQQAQEGGDTFVREAPKVGRNDPCPCGSGKKFKQCHGKLS